MPRSESKERKQRKYASIKTWMDKSTSGFKSSYLKLPKGAAFMEVKAGSSLIDVLPYEVKTGTETPGGNPHAKKGFLYWERTFWTHRGIGPNSEMVICLARTFKKPCPVCEERARILKNDPDDEDTKLADALKPKERQIFNVKDLKNPDKGVQILEMSSWLFGDELRKEIANSDEEDHWEMFFTPDEGKTLKVSWGQDKMGVNTFVRADSIHFKDRKEAYDEDEILGETFDLDSMLIKPDYDELKDQFLQGSDTKKKKTARDDDEDEEEEDEDTDSDDEEEDEEEDEPKKGKSSSSGKKKSSKSDSDDDEDEEEEDDEESDDSDEDDSDDEEEEEEEEEEDDEPKKKKAVKKKPSKSDDDEEEDEDESEDEEDEEEEDDEEEEAPKKKGAAKKKSKSDDDDEEEEESDEDDEADDDDFNDFDDEEDDEDKPAKKKKK